jgi:hypothetical protein
MFAAIRRYEVSALSTDALADMGWRLGAVMTLVSGFVAAVTVEAGSGALVTICLFEDRTSLEAAAPVAEKWTVEYGGVLGSSATEVVMGEVIAQRGL